MQETSERQVRSLVWEDPLEKEMATHSSLLTWRIPWTEEPGGLQSMGSKRVRQDWSNLAGKSTVGCRKHTTLPVHMGGLRYLSYCCWYWRGHRNSDQVYLMYFLSKRKKNMCDVFVIVFTACQSISLPEEASVLTKY